MINDVNFMLLRTECGTVVHCASPRFTMFHYASLCFTMIQCTSICSTTLVLLRLGIVSFCTVAIWVEF